jgi:uncharacterized phage protein (TIGR01671 family)
MNDRFKFRYLFDNEICEVLAFDISDGIEHKCLFLQLKDGTRKIINNYDWSKFMQCTGLKDKNGKLIYQGDILGDIYEGLYIHYCEHCHQLQLYSQGYGCMACNGDIHWIEVVEDNKKLEVIGNIYENEDLLNE